jgi:hypothetical protein
MIAEPQEEAEALPLETLSRVHGLPGQARQ